MVIITNPDQGGGSSRFGTGKLAARGKQQQGGKKGDTGLSTSGKGGAEDLKTALIREKVNALSLHHGSVKRTPLMYAAALGKADVIATLINQGMFYFFRNYVHIW